MTGTSHIDPLSALTYLVLVSVWTGAGLHAYGSSAATYVGIGTGLVGMFMYLLGWFDGFEVGANR